MLPFALKVVWFILSFIGIATCWTVLILLGRVVGSKWGPTLYSLSATMQHGMFCLGMIWEMDPYKMPRNFCIAQTFMIYYGSYSMTGICAAFTLITAGLVLCPSSMINPGKPVLSYQHKWCLPIFIYPLVCLAVAVSVVLKLDAIQPADGMACDASNPIWTRFLGYAGLPFLLAIPCFFLSAAAVIRVSQMHAQSHSRNIFSSNEQVAVRQFAPPAPSRIHFSVPEPQSNHNSETSLRLFASEQEKGVTLQLAEDDAGPSKMEEGHAVPSLPLTFSSSSTDLQGWDSGPSMEEAAGEDSPSRQRPFSIPSSPIPSSACMGPSLAPAIWRLLLFQMAFFSIEILSSISTIVDVARHRTTPSPFGTQHVALILDAWGPLIVFGQLPAIRQGLMFWRRRQPR
ncbi:hypothetical protein F5I97DRAFT_242028 [Phlebopus sp. FC_14]|nr:hypothetical protein F5I97DRAFT_242028 [Phlebopus sp. FC_14]